MGFDTVQDALAFVEELTANSEAIDAVHVAQQLCDLDVYLQHILKPKVQSAELYLCKPFAAFASSGCVGSRQRMLKQENKWSLAKSPLQDNLRS